ncbi:hypothetical protein QAD02_003097 [Eretmocerus hayati]|uniref:Uncharacterized protein n=1 Tax=Eretmocerus hayati TaxID=131215 RepID=A0ACC2NLZ7_9HYME|nr:hypothetical protein QAD02_003097 [Eretmocerus hayati]
MDTEESDDEISYMHLHGIQIDVVARIRCGHEEEKNKYWLDEKRRVCVLCEKATGSLEHLIGECKVTSVWVKELPGESSEAKLQATTGEIGDRRVCRVFRKIEQAKEGKRKREEIEVRNGRNRIRSDSQATEGQDPSTNAVTQRQGLQAGTSTLATGTTRDTRRNKG